MGDTGEKTSAARGAAKLLEVVQDLIAETHPQRIQTQPVTLDSVLDRDLGLDSLARVELLARLERAFGVALPERAAAESDTPRDLLRALRAADNAPRISDARDVASLELGDAQAAPRSAETLVDVMRWHVDAHATRPLIRFYRDDHVEDVASYGEVWEGSRAVASGLQHRGLEPGDRVGIMLPTGCDYFFAFFGILLAGGVPVPIYPPVRRTQIEDHLKRHRLILENAGAVALITVSEAKPFARILKSQVSAMRALVTVDELSASDGRYEPPLVKADHIALLQYTSGSTGQPKGVILTHSNILSNLRALGDWIQMDDTDVIVSWLPLYHDMGLIGALMGSLYYACLLVLMSPIDFVTRPQRWLWAIHRYRGTLSASPNFGYELCTRRLSEDDVQGLDLGSWRGALNGAEPVSADTIDRFCERFGKYGFRTGTMMPVYGLAENALGVTFPPLGRRPLIDAVQRDDLMYRGRALPAGPHEDRPLRVVACGRPLPGHEVRIVDDGGRELPDRHVGRLQFRGPSASSGYFRDVGATRALFDGDWLDSGDIAYVGDGDIYITGRAKDIVIRAGRNIAPSELEDAIGDIDGVRKGNVAVFGSTEPKTGTERLVILAETRESGEGSTERLRAAITALAVDFVGTPPDDIQLVSPGTVLKTSSGKIRRSANRDIYERGELRKRHRAVWWQLTRAWLSGLTFEFRRMRRQAGAWLYALHSWAVIVAITPIVWPAVVLLPRAEWRWFAARCAARFLGLATRTTPIVRGLENLSRVGGYVVVTNHASYLDSFALMAAVPRATSFVAKSELKKNVFVHTFLRRLRTQFVERFDKQKGIEDARRIGTAVSSGWPLVYYPEGSVTRFPGLRPFHMGAFVAAVENDVPVVPIALHGTRSMLRPGTSFPRRAVITVTVGAPVAPSIEPIDGKATRDTWSIALTLRDASRVHILRHCGEPDLPDDRPGV
jgi:acyl carrier protein